MKASLSRTYHIGAVTAAFAVLTIYLQASLTSAQETKRLVRMGYTQFAPYTYTEDGKPTGYSIDLLETIGAEAGWQVEYRRFENPAQILEALKSADKLGKMVDIIQGCHPRRFFLDF